MKFGTRSFINWFQMEPVSHLTKEEYNQVNEKITKCYNNIKRFDGLQSFSIKNIYEQPVNIDGLLMNYPWISFGFLNKPKISMDCHHMAFPSKRFDSTEKVRFRFRFFRGPRPLWVTTTTTTTTTTTSSTTTITTTILACICKHSVVSMCPNTLVYTVFLRVVLRSK